MALTHHNTVFGSSDLAVAICIDGRAHVNEFAHGEAVVRDEGLAVAPRPCLDPSRRDVARLVASDRVVVR